MHLPHTGEADFRAIAMRIPDQELFEPDPEKERQKPTALERLRAALFFLGAVVALAGTIYLSGFYQFFLFNRTSPEAHQKSLTPLVEGELLTLPLHVFVLTEEPTLGSSRQEDDVRRIVSDSSAIWKQANISFTVDSVSFVEVGSEELGLFLADPRTFLVGISGENFGSINVFLTKTLSGINGVAFTDVSSLVVADFTTSFDFRVLAHELGHILGLPHVASDGRRLMYQGADGFALTRSEALQARGVAQRFLTADR